MSNKLNEQLYSVFYRAGFLLKRKDVINIPITPGQLRLLHKISLHDNITQKDLLAEINVRPASLSAMLSKLEKGGYLSRLRDESDKRNMHIILLDSGKDIVDKFYSKQKDIAQEAFSCLDDAEQEQLLTLLVKLIDNWQNDEY